MPVASILTQEKAGSNDTVRLRYVRKCLLFFVWILVVLVLNSTASSNLVPVEEWNVTFNLEQGGTAYDVKATDDGFIIVGWTMFQNSENKTDIDVFLIKTDKEGNELWRKTFGENGYDKGFTVYPVEDGYLVLSSEELNGDVDMWLIKTDKDGNELWNKSFGGASYEYMRSIDETEDGYIFAGTTGSYGSADIWLIKTDKDGNELWNKSFGDAERDEGYAVLKTQGGYVIGGSTQTTSTLDMVLIKTDEEGNLIWSNTYGGMSDDEVYAMTEADDGYLLAGWTESYGAGRCDYYLVKTDFNGNKKWEKAFGGIICDRINSIKKTDDGFILGGIADSHGNVDGWVIKLDKDGKATWGKYLGGIERDEVFAVDVADDGYVAVGTTDSFSDVLSVWLVKLTEEEKEGAEGQMFVTVPTYEFYIKDRSVSLELGTPAQSQTQPPAQTSNSTPLPTPTKTTTQDIPKSEKTSESTPGFEIVFALAGMIFVLIFVNRTER